MQANNWLIVGCGYVGEAIGHEALRQGKAKGVVGVRRRAYGHAMPWSVLSADLTEPDWMQALPPDPFACVVFCAAPHQRDIEAYRALYVGGLKHVIDGLREHQALAPRLILTSSTGVYAENEGGWVDEETATPALTERIDTLLQAEALVHATGWTASILRFGGLYGPGRDRLAQKARQSPLPLRDRTHYTNHTHRDDGARSVVHVASLSRPDAVYVASDAHPVDYNTLLLRLSTGAAHNTEAQAPPTGPATGKRCSSARLQRSGFVFDYPAYDTPRSKVSD